MKNFSEMAKSLSEVLDKQDIAYIMFLQDEKPEGGGDTHHSVVLANGSKKAMIRMMCLSAKEDKHIAIILRTAVAYLDKNSDSDTSLADQVKNIFDTK